MRDEDDIYRKIPLLKKEIKENVFKQVMLDYFSMNKECLVINNLKEEIFFYDSMKDDGIPCVSKSRKELLEEIVNESFMSEGLGILKREGVLCKEMLEEVMKLQEEFAS